MPAKPAASQLRYDLTALGPADEVLAAFPELRAYPAFEAHGAGGNDALLRFIIFYCDPGSEYRDLPLDDKKRACLARAGVAAPRWADVTGWRDAGVVAMASQYIRLHNSLKYALWFHGRESAWQTIEQLAVPIEGAKTKEGDDDEAKTQTAYKTRRDNLDAMFLQVPKLDALRNELFMDDEQLGAAALLQVQQNTPTAEKRAEGRTFIPAPAK